MATLVFMVVLDVILIAAIGLIYWCSLTEVFEKKCPRDAKIIAISISLPLLSWSTFLLYVLNEPFWNSSLLVAAILIGYIWPLLAFVVHIWVYNLNIGLDSAALLPPQIVNMWETEVVAANFRLPLRIVTVLHVGKLFAISAVWIVLRLVEVLIPLVVASQLHAANLLCLDVLYRPYFSLWSNTVKEGVFHLDVYNESFMASAFLHMWPQVAIVLINAFGWSETIRFSPWGMLFIVFALFHIADAVHRSEEFRNDFHISEYPLDVLYFGLWSPAIEEHFPAVVEEVVDSGTTAGQQAESILVGSDEIVERGHVVEEIEVREIELTAAEVV